MEKEKIVRIIIAVVVISVSVYVISYTIASGWPLYVKLSIIIAIVTAAFFSGGRKIIFYDMYPMLRVDSIHVGGLEYRGPSAYHLSLENYRDVECRSNAITLLLNQKQANVDKIEPKGGGDVFTKGALRGPWDKIIPLLDSAKEGDVVIARVFTRRVDSKMCFCSCNSFIFQDGDWYRHYCGFAKTMEPYIFGFAPHRNCPFDRKEVIDSMKDFCPGVKIWRENK